MEMEPEQGEKQPTVQFRLIEYREALKKKRSDPYGQRSLLKRKLALTDTLVQAEAPNMHVYNSESLKEIFFAANLAEELVDKIDAEEENAEAMQKPPIAE